MDSEYRFCGVVVFGKNTVFNISLLLGSNYGSLVSASLWRFCLAPSPFSTFYFYLGPLNLSDYKRKVILKTFDKVKDIEFPSFLKQLKDRFPARVAIDKTVFRVLDFGDDEIDRILDYLYSALANEIGQLKTLMQG